jgi:uncharacterized FAD-dependent dehydrogenase
VLCLFNARLQAKYRLLQLRKPHFGSDQRKVVSSWHQHLQNAVATYDHPLLLLLRLLRLLLLFNACLQANPWLLQLRKPHLGSDHPKAVTGWHQHLCTCSCELL